jgi:hypothetical protein
MHCRVHWSAGLAGTCSDSARNDRAIREGALRNDFLYVEESLLQSAALDRLSREMCDRHEGIGADGLIVYAPPGRRCGC